MSDLIEFLRARLDEKEKTARDRLCLNCGNPVVPLRSVLGTTGYTHEGGRANEQGQWEQGWEGQRCPGKIVGAEPVQNPTRVLREVEAKRRIVDLHAHAHAHQCRTGEHDDGYAQWVSDCTTLRLLALPYADHPDYRPEWAPSEVSGA